MDERNKEDKRMWTEQLEVAANELADLVKKLIQEGTVRRVIIRKPSGEPLIEIPLVAGVGVAGAMTLFAPVLAAVGAMAALLSHVRVDVIHVQDEEGGDKMREPSNLARVGASLRRIRGVVGWPPR